MMWWFPAIWVAAAPVPGSPLKKRKIVVPTANNAVAGLGRGGRAQAYAAAGSAIAPSGVTNLNAMLYGRSVSNATVRSAEREVELARRKARVPVGRPARDAPLREEVVA